MHLTAQKGWVGETECFHVNDNRETDTANADKVPSNVRKRPSRLLVSRSVLRLKPASIVAVPRVVLGAIVDICFRSGSRTSMTEAINNAKLVHHNARISLETCADGRFHGRSGFLCSQFQVLHIFQARWRVDSQATIVLTISRNLQTSRDSHLRTKLLILQAIQAILSPFCQ
jgi:hypothetical protein